jgi:hypothetical protein
MVREGLSHRYTIMSLLGLYRLETVRSGSTDIPLDPIRDALLDRTDWIDNVGDLGLVLWLCAATAPQRLDDIYRRLSTRTALTKFQDGAERRTMEIAWLLSGLAHAALAGAAGLPELAHVSQTASTLLRQNQGNHGVFGHHSAQSLGPGRLRARIGSFADQVYPIYALAKYAQVCGSREALASAVRCGDAICRVQGPLGQWWWHYDAFTGKVFQKYPVYAVHQEGMAPMALFALSEASGRDYLEPIYNGLAWITGRNELRRDMREASPQLVWRSVYRANRLKMYIGEMANFVRPTDRPVPAGDLKIRFECRPYELGWLLYAFAGQPGSLAA